MPRKSIKTIDAARKAIREIGGPECAVFLTANHHDSYGPDYRYESVTYDGHLLLPGEPGESKIRAYVCGCATLQDLVHKLAQAMKRSIVERIRERQLAALQHGVEQRVRRALPPAKPLCLEYHGD